jgi:hypothetical protein
MNTRNYTVEKNDCWQTMMLNMQWVLLKTFTLDLFIRKTINYCRFLIFLSWQTTSRRKKERNTTNKIDMWTWIIEWFTIARILFHKYKNKNRSSLFLLIVFFCQSRTWRIADEFISIEKTDNNKRSTLNFNSTRIVIVW